VWRTVCWILRCPSQLAVIAYRGPHSPAPAAAVAQHLEWHRERYRGSLRLAATLADDPDAQKNTAVKEPSSGHEVEITQNCQVRVDASTGGVMSKRTFDTATEDLMAYNNRMQDDAFCQALRAALSAGKESCAEGVSTKPGTEKPILNYQRSD
jgi:hypothetical protein